MNYKRRKFENSNYINFLHKLPCSASGKAGEGLQVHHANVTGRGGIKNDYYGIPLKYYKHSKGAGHISKSDLEDEINENIQDHIIFLLSLYIEHLEGRYDPDMDMEIDYIDYRKKLNG